MLYLKNVAQSAGFHWESRSFKRDELLNADEVFLTSTPWCVLAAVQIDRNLIGNGVPGPVFHELLNAWSENVSLDLVEQARIGKMRQPGR